MAGCLPGNPLSHAIAKSSACSYPQEEQMSHTHKWYFAKEEIDNHSPSQKDGISFKKEAQLRALYCAYLSDLGISLNMPQKTIAVAMMICHRFFMRQSHAKNHWQIIAAAAMFLASKAEETPCFLKEIVIMANEKACQWDTLGSQKPLAQQKIELRETYDRQKETLLLGERLLLATLAFELSIELPYKPLIAAAKELKIPSEVTKVAWNYVNDWVQTTLCLEFKPQYIAAGSLYFAAQREKYQLPDKKGNVWWMHFSVSPKQLKCFIQHMQRFNLYQKQGLPSRGSSMITRSECKSQNTSLSSPESCVSNGSVAAKEIDNMTQLDSAYKLSGDHEIKKRIDVQDDFRKAKSCQTSDNTSSPNSAVEEGDPGLKLGKSEQNLGLKRGINDSHNNIDIDRIREKLKKRKLDRNIEKKVALESSVDIDDEAWIERELESGLKK